MMLCGRRIGRQGYPSRVRHTCCVTKAAAVALPALQYASQPLGNTKNAIFMAQTKRDNDFETALMLLLLVTKKSVIHARNIYTRQMREIYGGFSIQPPHFSRSEFRTKVSNFPMKYAPSYHPRQWMKSRNRFTRILLGVA
jgi:hypothetical protein